MGGSGVLGERCVSGLGPCLQASSVEPVYPKIAPPSPIPNKVGLSAPMCFTLV